MRQLASVFTSFSRRKTNAATTAVCLLPSKKHQSSPMRNLHLIRGQKKLARSLSQLTEELGVFIKHRLSGSLCTLVIGITHLVRELLTDELGHLALFLTGQALVHTSVTFHGVHTGCTIGKFTPFGRSCRQCGPKRYTSRWFIAACKSAKIRLPCRKGHISTEPDQGS